MLDSHRDSNRVHNSSALHAKKIVNVAFTKILDGTDLISNHTGDCICMVIA